MVNVAAFLSYLIVGGAVMIVAVRALYNFIDKLWVNHRPREEGILLKLTLLWRNSSIIALAAVSVTILYSVFITNIFNIEQVSASGLAAVGILFAVLNSVYRLATYGHVSRSDECDVDTERVRSRKSTLQRSYFSFLFSLLIFAYLGIGITILSDSLTPQSIIEVSSLGKAFENALRVVTTTLVLSVLTESLLWIGPLTIPDVLIDEID